MQLITWLILIGIGVSIVFAITLYVLNKGRKRGMFGRETFLNMMDRRFGDFSHSLLHSKENSFGRLK